MLLHGRNISFSALDGNPFRLFFFQGLTLNGRKRANESNLFILEF